MNSKPVETQVFLPAATGAIASGAIGLAAYIIYQDKIRHNWPDRWGLWMIDGAVIASIFMTIGLCLGLYIARNRSGLVAAKIADRQQTREEASKSQELYRNLIRNLPDLIILLLDSDLRLQIAGGLGLADCWLRSQVGGRQNSLATDARPNLRVDRSKIPKGFSRRGDNLPIVLQRTNIPGAAIQGDRVSVGCLDGDVPHE